MNYINNIRELVGNTPLLKINHFSLENGISVFAKLENFNPGGSVKDRMALSMIEEAEKNGQLKDGGTIIESTSGNAGIGIAFAALHKNYRVILVVPEKFSIEKQKIMMAYGATIVNTPEENGMIGAMSKVKELIEQIPNSISLEQFHNHANPMIHYKTTGPEIYKALDGNIDYFVAGAGSGGTYTGIMKFLKKKNSSIKGILVDPVGSTMGGGEEASYKMEGIGNNFIPETMDMNLVDDVIKVNDNEAFEMAKLLAEREGLIVGSSSGAAMSAVIKLSSKIKCGRIVTLFADRGDRYFSKNLF
ncbi:cysteine synthase [Clostridium acetobutylicum]|nr:cysteine synthase [Clostridium acetobutylicum]